MPGNEKKICFLLGDLGGGTGNHLLQMMKRLSPEQWDKSIISEAKLTARVAPEAPVDFLERRSFLDGYPLGQIHRLRQAARIIEERKPDILHAYFFWPIMYGRWLRRTGRIPVLIENREDQGFNWGPHEYALLRLTRSIPDRIVCVSNAVRSTVLEREKIDPARTVVIYNGVDTERLETGSRQQALAELGLDESHHVVGMVANFNRGVKGVHYFVQALPLVLASCSTARFVLFGRGSEETELRALAAGLGVEQQLIFAGFRKDIDRFYSVMSISALTSLSEGFSITLLESMKHGLPVVATAVGGNPELVINGKTGYLVPPRDAGAFADKVTHLLLNPNLAASMGEAGRERILEEFSLAQTARKYQELYLSLLSQKAPQ